MEYPVIDCHVHLRGGAPAVAKMAEQQQRWGHTACCAQSLEGNGPGFQEQNAVCVAFKRDNPHMYAFSGLNHARGDFAGQARALWDIGCDGFKMIEGKPDTWKRWGAPLDGDTYEDFFRFCEDVGAPVLLHTADPAEFWDINKISKEALKYGWYYDSTFPQKEALLSQTIHIAKKHPRLKLILAHFFFLSGEFERMGALLDEHPNLHIDITPGAEMYVDFARDKAATRVFFQRYNDRILYGTDSIDAHTPEQTAYADQLVTMVRRCLDSEQAFEMWDFSFSGFALPQEALPAILAGNFLRIAPHRPLDADKARAYFTGMLRDDALVLSDDEREAIQACWGNP